MREVGLALGGLVVVVIAVAVGGGLAAESRSPGSVGFPLFLALPGLALVAQSLGDFEWRRLLAVGSVATLLLGLDVTDSARAVVVNGGYAVALASVVACVALVMLPGRQRAR